MKHRQTNLERMFGDPKKKRRFWQI